MNSFLNLTKRNSKLFFKDKGMFFCSLITPIILLVLYATFLGRVFKDSYLSSIPEELNIPEKIINGLAGGQLLSSLLAVSCVTVAFCSNMLMVQDKITGARKDLLMTPLKKSTLSISYYVSTLITTLIISVTATIIAWIYLSCIGWFLSFVDCLMILLNVLLLTMFGTALSSIVNFFLSSQGQVSAVGTIVSSMYGFISGAYMPIASFGIGLQKVLMFLPSTYGSALIRNYCMRGALSAFEKSGIPTELISEIRKSIDCDLYFFGNKVSLVAMYGVMIGTIAILLIVYILINKFSKKKS
ncbi:MAG: ABC transporter permease [Christensenellales bacterium]